MPRPTPKPTPRPTPSTRPTPTPRPTPKLIIPSNSHNVSETVNIEKTMHRKIIKNVHVIGCDKEEVEPEFCNKDVKIFVFRENKMFAFKDDGCIVGIQLRIFCLNYLNCTTIFTLYIVRTICYS